MVAGEVLFSRGNDTDTVEGEPQLTVANQARYSDTDVQVCETRFSHVVDNLDHIKKRGLSPLLNNLKHHSLPTLAWRDLGVHHRFAPLAGCLHHIKRV